LIVLDTHSLIWLIQEDSRLGPQARSAIVREIAAGGVLVPAMSVWETAMLVRRGRLELGMDVSDWCHAVLSVPGIRLAPLEPDIAIAATGMADWAHRDPADRIIVATARHHRAALFTTDRAILAYAASSGHIEAIDAAV
jgi:PIN domain nuclease of toxin-antitoxin system